MKNLILRFLNQFKQDKSHFLLFISILTVIGCKQDNTNGIDEIKKTTELITEQPLDSILKKQLELIAVEDQTLRLMLPEVTEKFGRESSEYKYIWSLINRQDSICIKKLIKIVDTHGWVGKNRIGAKANQGIWLIIQHAELKVQEKYLPLLKESVKKNESEGWHLAFLEDRVLMHNEKKQKYGTQAIWDANLMKNRIYPIEDLKNVNQRRLNLGLETIEEYAKINGHIFDQKE